MDFSYRNMQWLFSSIQKTRNIVKTLFKIKKKEYRDIFILVNERFILVQWATNRFSVRERKKTCTFLTLIWNYGTQICQMKWKHAINRVWTLRSASVQQGKNVLTLSVHFFLVWSVLHVRCMWMTVANILFIHSFIHSSIKCSAYSTREKTENGHKSE